MPRFAANLSLQYNEMPFMERFAAAAQDGFSAVEYLFPYAFEAGMLATQLQAHGLRQVLFNAPPGGSDLSAMASAWERGERGTACLPGRESEFRAGITQALLYAQALHCPRLHVMAGLSPAGADRALLQATYEANLRWATAQAAPLGVTLLIEAINGRDMPDYFLQRQGDAHATVQAVGSAHLQVMMDLYHCQIMEGDLSAKLRHYLAPQDGQPSLVGHIQIAGVPQRHEPDVGEVNYAHLFALIDSLGYPGWVGCEYRPARGTAPGATHDGLGWRDRALAASTAPIAID
jgi:hydroxypyruvate isomerase